jgi:hypothetical protein
MDSMTAQEIFDKVASHLLTQNARSVRGSSDICAYRSLDGKQCAVGCLIEPEEYEEWMEGMAIDDLLQQKNVPQTLHDRLNDHMRLLRDLQWIHDRRAIIEWSKQLQTMAERYHLKFDPDSRSK